MTVYGWEVASIVCGDVESKMTFCIWYCSLDDNCAEGQGYIMVTVETKALEFVDDTADLNSGSEDAANSNKVIVGIQERKRLTFDAERCKILKISSSDF